MYVYDPQKKHSSDYVSSPLWASQVLQIVLGLLSFLLVCLQSAYLIPYWPEWIDDDGADTVPLWTSRVCIDQMIYHCFPQNGVTGLPISKMKLLSSLRPPFLRLFIR